MKSIIVAAVAAFLLIGCASRERRDDNPFVSAAQTPLRDVGVIRPTIPEELRDIVYPYAMTPEAPTCQSISAEIAMLTGVLGEESYQPGEERNLASRAAEAAEDYAAGELASAAEIVPYRGWVRRLSGASRAERRAAAAYARGEQRRTFLRGLGVGLGCEGLLPAPPPQENAQPR